jgi:hypothetical protein
MRKTIANAGLLKCGHQQGRLWEQFTQQMSPSSPAMRLESERATDASAIAGQTDCLAEVNVLGNLNHKVDKAIIKALAEHSPLLFIRYNLCLISAAICAGAIKLIFERKGLAQNGQL